MLGGHLLGATAALSFARKRPFLKTVRGGISLAVVCATIRRLVAVGLPCRGSLEGTLGGVELEVT